MGDQLQHRADAIQKVLSEHPQSGAHLLLDFARNYAGDKKQDDDAVLLKLDFENAINERERQEIIQQMRDLLEMIVKNYDEKAIRALKEREKAISISTQKQEASQALILKAKGLSKNFKRTKFNLKVDQLELRLGEITALLGENATGKTTLFQILAGELARDKGTLNYPLFQGSQKRLNWIKIKQKIAFLPQQLSDWHGSLKDNIQLEASYHGLKGVAVEKATNYIIQRLGLAGHIDKSWQQLSAGYKLRFALAKSLVWNPQLIILDEPLSFLDIKTQLIVLNDLNQLAKSLKNPISVLLSSQHIHEVEAIADKILFMREGKILYNGERKHIGISRQYNSFELSCQLSLKELYQVLHNFQYKAVYETGLAYVIHTPLEIKAADLIHHLWSQEVEVLYFRNISNSLKTHFYETLN